MSPPGRKPRHALSNVVPLAPVHKTGAFACGDNEIDVFLRERAAAEQALRLSQVYVTVDQDGEIAAYFTLSPITVRIEPGLLAHIGVHTAPYPVIGGFLLGRLGVHRPLQGAGIGEAIVMRAAQIAKYESEVVGGAFLAVDPKTDRLAQWYARQDFVALGAKSRRMVLPFRSVP